MNKNVIFIAGIFVAILSARPTWGQQKAKELFDEGIAAIEAGNFEKALSALEEAYSISPHWAVLPHIGNCHVNLNHPIEAIAAFEKYLETGGTNISEEEQEIAREMIRQEKKKVGVLVLEVGKSGVEAKIDEESIGTSPFEKQLLMPGQHEVTVRFSDQNIVTKSVTLQKGEELLLRVKEQEGEVATAPPSPAVTESETEEAAEEDEEDEEEEEEPEEEDEAPGEGSYVPAFVSGGVAAAGLIAGGLGFGIYVHYNATAQNYQETLDELRMKYPDDFGGFTWDDTCSIREVESEEAKYFCNTEFNRRDMEDKKVPWLIVGAVGAGVFGAALIPTILFALNPEWFGKGDDQVSSLTVIPMMAPDNRGFLLNLSF